MHDDTRDRVIRLESQVDHLTKAVERLADQNERLVTAFEQARGAKWVFMAMVGVGGFLAGKLPAVAAWLVR